VSKRRKRSVIAEEATLEAEKVEEAAKITRAARAAKADKAETAERAAERAATPPITVEERDTGRAFVALVAVSGALLAARWFAARAIGFGDSEALYACYAKHPQAAYLDHPGLVGLLASAMGDERGPTPASVHALTAVFATVYPWLWVLVARRVMNASRAHALLVGVVVAVVPEIAIGLFALTPDLPLAFAELAAIGAACVAMNEEPRTGRAAGLFALAGTMCGVAAASKLSGLLLFPAFAIAFARGRHARTPWPWAGLFAGLMAFAPVARYEVAHGFPMLRHRLVDTQVGAGPSLRNMGALLGGQLLYLSPILAVIAVALLIDLWRRRNEDDTARLLAWSTVIPLATLAILGLVSRVAEPHWLAPAWLPLPLWAARRATLAKETAAKESAAKETDAKRPRLFGARWVGGGVVLAVLMVAAVHAWVLVPTAPKLAPKSYDAKLDIANELFGWPDVVTALGEVGAADADTVVVGPHWVVCAQLHAALEGARVGCDGAIPDDFDGWLPKDEWRRADRILFVTDARFPIEPEKKLTDYNLSGVQHVTTLRAGRAVRTFTITTLERRARASL
jgi:hypothetical protein